MLFHDTTSYFDPSYDDDTLQEEEVTSLIDTFSNEEMPRQSNGLFTEDSSCFHPSTHIETVRGVSTGQREQKALMYSAEFADILPTISEELEHGLEADPLRSSSMKEADAFRPLSMIVENLQRGLEMDQLSVSSSTYWSISSLKERLPKYSSKELRGVMRLIKAHSISNSSAATIKSWHATRSHLSHLGTTAPSMRKDAATPDLAASLLVVDVYQRQQGLCIEGLIRHDLKYCWCAVMEELESKSRNWLYLNKENKRESHYPWERIIPDSGLGYQDDFGNTILHFLAARGAPLFKLLEIIRRMDLIGCSVDLNSKNMAGQSFLHLFGDEPRNGIHSQLDSTTLNKLKSLGFQFQDCDHLGRSPFHHLSFESKDAIMMYFCQTNYSWLLTLRDAYGCTIAMSPWSSDHLEADPHHEHSDDIRFSIHARLLETARLAFDAPRIEDDGGRNGLHCLAEASLNLCIDRGKVRPVNVNKRKINSSKGETPSRLKLRCELVHHPPLSQCST